ncbi:cellulase family glycosylhydrolase [uncultured Ruminococcus sp.]|uniref:cellulase family glycosylhydrolase n=1 Tax=uncultured Ruminococcus sp. TaxID=165186 RepID=UPI002607B226|nr:cellulase family glycosylhydrolase [uncultured Ruminococcus sp.]
MKSFIRRTVSIAAAAACMLTSFHFTNVSEVTEADAASGMGAFDITREMKIGWNLGNSLDATGGDGNYGLNTEISWHNPKTTQAMIDTVKKKGFNTVRIPTTWYPHLDGSNNIDSAWMNRVKEVVDYCIKDDMYVILNVHHEDWVNVPTFTDQTYRNAETKLTAIWKQVAATFKDYDQHLVFEGLNEPRQTGNSSVSQWGNGGEDGGYTWNYINKLNAKFVETVRAQGSSANKERLLMLPGYCASSDMKAIRAVSFPSGCGNVAYSVHAYLPYYFTMAEDQYANHNYPGKSGWGEDYTSNINSFFSGLKQLEDEKNIPVVIGEFSASNFNNLSSRQAWAKDYITQAKKAGIPCILWDNNVEGNNGGEAHGYLNRGANSWYSASEPVIDTMMSVINDNSILWAGKQPPATTASTAATTTTQPAEPYPYDDYFKNDFESGTDEWSGRGSAKVGTDSKNYYSGSSSLYVSGREKEWNGCAITLDKSLFIPGETYSFSAAVLQKSGSAGTIQMSLQQNDGSDASYHKIASCDAKSGEWTKLENTEFTIPTGGNDLVLYIETPEGSGDLFDFYVDTVKVSKPGIGSSVETGKGTVDSSGSQPGGDVNKDGAIKIMPIGDSITFGYGHTGGYRKFLDYYLKDKGYTKVDMVGPEGSASASFSFNGKTVSYDDNHAGYSGYTIKQKYPVPSWGENGLLEKLKDKNAVASAKPDVVLLIIGTNDMTANRSLSECESDLHDLVDYILADMPSGGMVFMGSIPEFTAYGGNSDRVKNYNATVKKVAESYQNAGKNVRFADVHGCLNGMNDIDNDQLHPTENGYEKMGKFWAGIVDEYVSSLSNETTSEATTETTTTTELKPTVKGDANLDTIVNIADAVLVMQVATNPDKYGQGKSSVSIKPQGEVNADVDGKKGLTNSDALLIQQFKLGLIQNL